MNISHEIWRNWDSWHDSCDYKNTWKRQSQSLRICLDTHTHTPLACHSIRHKHRITFWARNLFSIELEWLSVVRCACRTAACSSIRLVVVCVAALFLLPFLFWLLSRFSRVQANANATGQILIRNTWQIFQMFYLRVISQIHTLTFESNSTQVYGISYAHRREFRSLDTSLMLLNCTEQWTAYKANVRNTWLTCLTWMNDARVCVCELCMQQHNSTTTINLVCLSQRFQRRISHI